MLKYFLILSLSVYIAESKTVCYGDLGCFSDSYPFWCFPQRPLSTLPDPPEKIATKFTLYNRHGATKGHVIRYDFIGDEYDPKKETKFIVHGFLENAVKPWVLEMKDALLKSGDINVITIDWSKGNGPLYTQATANTQVVGRETARLINHMIEHKKAHSSSFHIIGHSLGSHIAGYAGENVVRLGRITGLDPAGPYFENTDPIVRLDPTDAVVVDAIHSDGTANLLLGLGMMQPVGHADYYPNGGKDQPNCPATSGKILGAIFGALILDVDYISGIS
jgi:pimeloyl-ACP methyl ester carboxylesterase